MTVTHYLITDATAAEVEEKTGIHGHPTPLGTLIEKPKTSRWREDLAIIERALNPNPCTCGYGAIMHRPGCPAYLMMT